MIDNHLLPQWQAWPMIGIFNSSLEIEKWVSELPDEYADSTMSTIFSTVTNAVVRARMIPASPCQGIRVTSGEFDVDRLVVTPVQVLPIEGSWRQGVEEWLQAAHVTNGPGFRLQGSHGV